ncbi:hypothetical protein T492DRAFT_842494 [Pavlovales sp. CCMP2436]|nr:hypothetical protein T492DRAFT_842494 [Pavlovales sp. CCMP2436]
MREGASARERPPKPAAKGTSIRPAHCALLALVVWGVVWSVHLAILDLPNSRQAGLTASSDRGANVRARRAKRAHRGMVMEDGTVVPVKQAVRPEVALPGREALLAEKQITLVLLATMADESGTNTTTCLFPSSDSSRPREKGLVRRAAHTAHGSQGWSRQLRRWVRYISAGRARQPVTACNLQGKGLGFFLLP